MAKTPPAPRPTASDPYPEWRERRNGGIDRAVSRFLRARQRRKQFRKASLSTAVEEISRQSESLARRGDGELQKLATLLRSEFRKRGMSDELLMRSFALTREVSRRVLGLRPLDTQLLAGWIMVRGGIAEMATGEGKTLAATLPACAAGLAGCPVHVVTSNDYLAARDAKEMSPIYRALGLEVDAITAELADESARRTAYRSDIVYTTGQQLAFDYLRDRTAGRVPDATSAARRAISALESPERRDDPLLRGLCFAIVDEADHVLIDEARTPLIVSQQSPDRYTAAQYEAALELARRLRRDVDFELDLKNKRVRLQPPSVAALAEVRRSASLGPLRQQPWEELVELAVAALHLFRRDIDYLVDEGRVAIVDPRTGRALPDRSWELGLHQLIECKESCETTPGKETLARISFQQFYRRYLQLGGMTGTAREVTRELAHVYELAVVAVPPARPVLRIHGGERIARSTEQKRRMLIECVRKVRGSGQPLLIGTQTVEDSLVVSSWLRDHEIEHRLLNATTHREEAEIIGCAGELGAITVATNMAGRGTDIRLAEGVVAQGGLFVLSTGRG
ncbi:MAG: hypothetical protein HKP27_05105, partial [Myxococcales bacterium]|nr:hypothetical protein [Myxococcales bacterium]